MFSFYSVISYEVFGHKLLRLRNQMRASFTALLETGQNQLGYVPFPSFLFINVLGKY